MKKSKNKGSKKKNYEKEDSESNSSNEKNVENEEEEDSETEEINNITVPKSSKLPNVQLEIDNFTKGNSRQFEIEQIENNMFRIKSIISGLYIKIKEGFKHDEVVQDELDENNIEFNWIFEIKDNEKNCFYIKSAVGGFDSQDFYMIIDGYVPKPHSKIIIGNFEPSQSFMLCRKV